MFSLSKLKTPITARERGHVALHADVFCRDNSNAREKSGRVSLALCPGATPPERLRHFPQPHTAAHQGGWPVPPGVRVTPDGRVVTVRDDKQVAVFDEKALEPDALIAQCPRCGTSEQYHSEFKGAVDLDLGLMTDLCSPVKSFRTFRIGRSARVKPRLRRDGGR